MYKFYFIIPKNLNILKTLRLYRNSLNKPNFCLFLHLSYPYISLQKSAIFLIQIIRKIRIQLRILKTYLLLKHCRMH